MSVVNATIYSNMTKTFNAIHFKLQYNIVYSILL